MGEDPGSWFPQQYFHWKLPDSTLPNLRGNLWNPDLSPAEKKFGHNNMVPSDQVSPLNVFSGLAHPRVNQSKEPLDWYYCLPRFRQGFSPNMNTSVQEDKLPVSSLEKCQDFCSRQNAGCIDLQNKFVVFDRSGDQTTLIWSSGKGIPNGCLPTLDHRKIVPRSVGGTVPCGITGPDNHSGPILTSGIHENQGTSVQSEMHEDTEELNALLYSDDETAYTTDEDDDDDDEVTSTGHSPSTMTGHKKHDLSDESSEEVASSMWPVKKRKLSNEDFDGVPSFMDTATSYPDQHIESMDDAESSCASGNRFTLDGMASLTCNKKIKRARIRETVNILQSIVPGGKGKNAIVVLDEAINYLKSLKRKAHVLGLTP